MAIDVSWDNAEKTIIRWHFPAQWTWDDYYGALQISRQLTKQAKTIVDILVDMQHSKLLPNHLFTHAQNALQTGSLNVGVIVIVGINPLLRSAYSTFKRIYDTMTHSSRHELHLVATEQKAYQIIEDARHKRQQSATKR
jgi:hypothetical protein